MATAAILIRRGEKQDVHFLRDMVRHSGLGRSGYPIDMEPPPLSRYVAGWGRTGDQSVVALDDATGVAVGAAWYRLFTAAEPGYGYVDDETPEVTIAVVPSRRNQGIGQALLEAVIAEARRAGHGRISLSTRQGDAAIGLFDKLGFIAVETHGTAVTMSLNLK